MEEANMRHPFAVVTGLGAIAGLLVVGAYCTPNQSTPQETPSVSVLINMEPTTDGVDRPWFTLSVRKKETVQWTNGTKTDCLIWIGKDSPFDDRSFLLPAGARSKVYSVTRAPQAPEVAPPGEVYKVYKYGIDCGEAGFFDPGWGVTP
jgi:hypothetical protein